MVETNNPWTDKHFTELRSVLSPLWPYSQHIQANCPTDPNFPKTSGKQQGGFLQFAHGSHSGRIKTRSTDYLGRWGTQIIQLRQGRSLAILTAYRPCKDSLASASEGTILKQQFSELRRRGVAEPKPRQQFIYDLTKHVLHLQSEGHAVMIGIDANLSRPDPEFEKFMETCGLLDLLAEKHPNPTATHKKGNRLDLILGCPFVLEHVVRIGILDDSYGAESDHATLYADLSKRIFCKQKDPTSPSQRGFRINDKARTANFRKRVTKALKSNRALEKLEAELDATSDTVLIEHLCNSIDEILTETVLDVEDRVRRRSQHAPPWSTMYRDARDAVRSWTKTLRKMKRTQTIQTPIPAQFPQTFQSALHYVLTQLKSAWKQLREIKKDAFAHRIKFLRGRITAHEKEGHPDKAENVREKLEKELRRRTFQKLRVAFKGAHGSGLDRVLRPTAQGHYEEITDVDQLFEVLLERNSKHFGQAKETPLAKPPHADVLPPFDYSDTVQEILAGDLSSFDNLTPEVEAFLNNMERTITDTFSSDMTNEQFKDGMKKVSEGKSSSLSGRHYGIYKALLQDDCFTSRVVRILNLSVKHGFILQRWRKVLQVMLLKEPGNYKIDRLRVIQLIEADINMYFRLIWGKRLVRHSLHRDRIPYEQFGSKPGALAMSAVLLKVASFDLIRLLRAQATIFNNDASACYDRILPVLAQICCERLGLPPIAAKFQLEFLKAAQYYIKTQHGVSADWFGNAITEVYGVLQGSGSAPAIWLAVSIVLINTYNALFPTLGIPDPQNIDNIQKIIDAFVDDTDLWDILFEERLSDDEAMERMRTRAQTWERLMFASGGKLNWKKCFWYYVSWNWTDGIPEISTKFETPGELILISSVDNQPKTITRKDTHESLETLGLWTSPSGNNNKEMQILKQHLRSMVEGLQRTTLPPDEAAIVQPIYVIPKLGYVFAGSTLDRKQCGQLDKIILPPLKSMSGYNRTTKLAIMHGSYQYCGAQLPTSWDIQGSVHVNLLIGHLQLGDIVGRHLKHCLDYLYLLIGIPDRTLSYPFEATANLAEHAWITNTWDYMSDIGATLHTPSLYLPPQRQHDTAVMPSAIRKYRTKSNKRGITLARINAVRIYRRVFYVSDMVTSDGLRIAPEYLDEDLPPTRESTLFWPYQEAPGPKAWAEWRTMLSACFTTGSEYLLRRPLGNWTDTTPRTQRWHTVIDPRTSDVFVKRRTLWHLYQSPTRARTRVKYADVHPAGPPSQVLPVTLQPHPRDPDILLVLPHAPQAHTSLPRPPPITTFHRYLRNLPKHEKWVIGHVMPLSPADTTNLLHAIQTGDFYLGSDGSVDGQSTTYASRVQSCSTLTTFIASHSRAEPTCTLRAEAYGYLGALYILRAGLNYLQHFGHTLPTTINHHHMDNTGVLNRLDYGPAFAIKHIMNRHSDVLREIQAVEASLSVTIRRHHVKSHQNENITDITKLSPPVRINRMCDVACTVAHTCSRCTTPIAPPTFPSTTTYVLIDNQPHTSKLDTDLLYKRHSIDLRAYIVEQENWHPTTFDLVHWPAIQLARYRQKSAGRRASTKLSFKLWATNEVMSERTKKERIRVDHRCTRCNRLHEDYDHIFHCRASKAILQTALTTFQKYLQQHRVAPPMIQAMLHGIRTYLTPSTPAFNWSQYPTDAFLQLVQLAYHHQDTIGWSNFLRGRYASTWLCAHDDYKRARGLHNRYSTTQLAPNLVLQLWSFSLTVWQQRNTDVHGATLKEAKSIQSRRIDDKITEVYHQRAHFSSYDQSILFTKTLEQRLATQLLAKFRWYSLYETCTSAPKELTENPPPPSPAVSNFFLPVRNLFRMMANPPAQPPPPATNISSPPT